MKTIILAIVFSLSLFLPQFALGNDPPKLISPQNGDQSTLTKLTWETPPYTIYSNNPYNVEIDNNQDFSSLEKDYQTKNTSYTPQLEEGLWYWRVKVKDSEDNWSNFSSSWSFTLTKETPSPTISTPSEESSSDSTSKTQSFAIESIPSEIKSNESFDVSINIDSQSNPNALFYLKGAFKNSDSTNYFGQTLVQNDWIKNNKSYSDQFKITTDGSGKFKGKLSIKPDSEDSGFRGSGEYIFKVAKYSSTGSGLTWSNEEKIYITEVKTEVSSDEMTPTPIPSPSLTTKTISKLVLASNSATPSSNSSPINPDIAGISTSSPQSLEMSYRSVNWWYIGGGILFLLLGIGFVVKLAYEKRQDKNFNKLR